MPPHILVIDDEEMFAEFLVTLLQRSGFAAESLQPGYGAIRRIAETHARNPLRLLICDLFMPEPDGFEILRFAQESLPGVPLIGMSGKNGVLLDAMRRLGARQVFAKPIDTTLFMAQVRQILTPAAVPAEVA